MRLSRDLRRLTSNPAALAACAIVLGGTVASAALFPADPARAQDTPTARAAAAQAQVDAEPPLTDAQKGQVRESFDKQPRLIVPADNQGASVAIVKFNDYLCPPCKQTFDLYKPIKDKWAQQAPGKVTFITRDFPLEPECNPSAPNGSHQAACEAAAAVRMARTAGKADALEDWLFARQPTLTPAVVKEGLQEVAGITDFDSRYQSALTGVKSDAALGASLGVGSTPTFFINGVRVAGGIAPRVLDYLIEYEMSKVSPPAVK